MSKVRKITPTEIVFLMTWGKGFCPAKKNYLHYCKMHADVSRKLILPYLSSQE